MIYEILADVIAITCQMYSQNAILTTGFKEEKIIWNI